MNYTQVTNSAPVVLVEFYASWCPHCQKMMPIVEEVKELLADSVPVYQFDIDKNREAADAAGVENIPTFIVYKNGEAAWSHSGELSGEVLLRTVQSYL